MENAKPWGRNLPFLPGTRSCQGVNGAESAPASEIGIFTYPGVRTCVSNGRVAKGAFYAP